MAHVTAVDAMRCPLGHPVDLGTPGLHVVLIGHLRYRCPTCNRRMLFAFTRDTGPLAIRLDVTLPQWHALAALAGDPTTADYLALLATFTPEAA